VQQRQLAQPAQLAVPDQVLLVQVVEPEVVLPEARVVEVAVAETVDL
jgi:hypothetical protein